MNELGKNIAYYRKEKGLSQEKLAEYMKTSRQAVTKWENGQSKPSTENLIKLSELFCVEIENLLITDTANREIETKDVSMGKGPGIWCMLSAICVIVYALYGILNKSLDIGSLVCSCIIAFPIQLFLNLYLTNAIRNNDYQNIAGFDPNINYNTKEVKKLLVNINQHISVASTVYIFLICILSNTNIQNIDIAGFLIFLYVIEFIGTIMFLNYRACEKIYCSEDDKKIAKSSWPITVSYLILLLAGSASFLFAFYAKGIDNNTAPALVLSVLMLAGIIFATAGYFKENKKLRKEIFTKDKYQTSKLFKICYAVAILCFMAIHLYRN